MKITALAGGVGAAKLISGLAGIMAPGDLTVVVNTGDDFRWMGLYICPDLDTMIYTLAGVANPETGWGVAHDSFHCLERLGRLGCDTWFRLGDMDLATHLYRTNRLNEDYRLSEVTRELCRQNGIHHCILPMSDDAVPTRVHTNEGELDFQDYFVRRKCVPHVEGFSYAGADRARPAPGVLAALQESEAIVICPSNPYVSIGPILAVPGIRDALRRASVPVLAVSPIVGGEALKGPAAAMMRQLGASPSAAGIAGLYRDFVSHLVIDRCDEALREEIEAPGMRVILTDTIMRDRSARAALAAKILEILSCPA